MYISSSAAQYVKSAGWSDAIMKNTSRMRGARITVSEHCDDASELFVPLVPLGRLAYVAGH